MQHTEVSALRSVSPTASYSATSPSYTSSGELEAQIIALEAQIKEKDSVIADLGDKMQRNMTDYANLVGRNPDLWFQCQLQ
jgi:hypothetical protein